MARQKKNIPVVSCAQFLMYRHGTWTVLEWSSNGAGRESTIPVPLSPNSGPFLPILYQLLKKWHRTAGMAQRYRKWYCNVQKGTEWYRNAMVQERSGHRKKTEMGKGYHRQLFISGQIVKRLRSDPSSTWLQHCYKSKSQWYGIVSVISAGTWQRGS